MHDLLQQLKETSGKRVTASPAFATRRMRSFLCRSRFCRSIVRSRNVEQTNLSQLVLTSVANRKDKLPTLGDAILIQVTGLGIRGSADSAAKNANTVASAPPKLWPVTKSRQPGFSSNNLATWFIIVSNLLCIACLLAGLCGRAFAP
jgi:hypothetical protein